MPIMPMLNECVFDVAGDRELTFEKVSGSYVWDDAGRRYLDFMAGHGVMNMGHSRPEISQAVNRQLSEIVHCSAAFSHKQRQRLMTRLSALTGMVGSRVFLSNSGTESVEAALKFARIHTGRSKIVGCIRGFHGRTYGALSAGFNPRHRKGCGSLLPDCEHIAFSNLEALRAAIDENTAAFILEIVQGEGGVRVATDLFVQEARRLCHETGALLIVDEVQTGFARCGPLFAYQRHQILPDIVCMAKSLGGGLPIGATVFDRAIQPVKGMHGSTFGGNPLSCAAANAFLDVLLNDYAELQIEEKGAHLADSLRSCSQVTEVRQIGLMLAADITCSARLMLAYIQKDGLLALSAGPQTLRFLPPLNTSWSELNEGIAILKRTLN